MPDADPDLDLVRALQGGNDSALNELMTRHQNALLGLIYRHVGDATLAQEILQETFVRAYFGISSFKPRAKFVAWLFSIAVNLCRDYSRSKRGWQAKRTVSWDEITEASGETPSSQSQGTPPNAALEQREALEALDAAVAQLPHDLKTALILFAIDGHSQEECAELLAISPKAVETRVYRARRLLEKSVRGIL